MPPINRTILTSPNAGRSSVLSDSEEPAGGGRARWMRKHPSQAEYRFWFALRALKPLGFHFRRQAPIGRYVVDFVCHRAKIVVEIDGSQHGEPENILRDEKRTAFLRSRGYRVLRFWNIEANEGQEEVIAAILRAATPHPSTYALRATVDDLPALGEVRFDSDT
ncbi:MAG TPA: endonuclease domain-containing protein [Rhizomicrobium sp.]|nr:endonuclease domain-containing protein [Rhizomicrobium sp.]